MNSPPPKFPWSHNDLTLYPELLTAAVKANEHDLLLVYQIAKLVDAKNTRNGILRTDSIYLIADWLFGYQDRRLDQRILLGDGKYWRLGGDKAGLVSPKQVISRLQPALSPSRPLALPIASIRDYIDRGAPAASLKRLYIAITASRGGRSTPCSVASLSHDFGVSERTVQRAIAGCDALEVINNFRVHMVAENRGACEDEMAKLGLVSPRTMVRRHLSEYWLVEQIPSSYEIHIGDWLPLRNRLLALKNYLPTARVSESIYPERVLYHSTQGSKYWR